MAEKMLGKEVAAALRERVLEQVVSLKAQGVEPALGILRVGEDPSDLAYERSARKRCEDLGIAVKSFVLPRAAEQETLLETIRRMNADDSIHGILMFRPLPGHLDEEEACRALAPEKDVDGITEGSLAGVFTGQPVGFPPCTPQACMEILGHYGIACSGKRAVVIGRSLVVGKPAAMMLLKRNATVTICHTRTKDLPAVCREADILLVAAGKAGVVGPECLREGQIVLDVGIHSLPDGSMMGDVAKGAPEGIVRAYTPVPGGVGTVTSMVLAAHVAEAARRLTDGR